MDFEPVHTPTSEKVSLSVKAAEDLVSFIIARDLQAGDRLPNETKLAAMLQVGRGTLREAIRQLVSRNVLETRQGSGTYVSHKRGIPEDPLGTAFLSSHSSGRKLALDLIDVRIALEPQIAATAAIRREEGDLSELLTLQQEYAKAIESGGDYRSADTAFHMQIAHCSQNAIFTNLVSIVSSSVMISTSIGDIAYRNTGVKYHEFLCRAICEKDFLGAQNAMLAHLNISREYYLQSEDAPIL